MMAIWVFLANAWSSMYVWIEVYVGVYLRHVSRYVPAMFCRYMALEERDVVGVCFGECIEACSGVYRGVTHASLHEILTRHSWKQPYRI